MSTTVSHLSQDQMAQYHRDGFLILKKLFSPHETQTLQTRFMEIQRLALDANSQLRHHYQPQTLEEVNGDILRHFPRIMMPHRFDALSKQYLLDSRIGNALHNLLGEEPLAAQSMLYFKPPGARGQAFHQDDYYLKTAPGHCVAAWVALDDCNASNGTLFIVPGSHTQPVLCPHAADLTKSFTIEEVDIPGNMQPQEVIMDAGDVLFFNGAVIHGSTPNTTKDRFRRSFICHYVPNSMTEMSAGYYPLHRFNGQTLERSHAEGGGPCGTEEWAAFVAGAERERERVSPKN